MSSNLEGQAQNNDVQNSSSSAITSENMWYLLNKATVSQTQVESKFPMGGNIQVQGGQKNIQLSLQKEFWNNTSRWSVVLQLKSPGPVSPHC